MTTQEQKSLVEQISSAMMPTVSRIDRIAMGWLGRHLGALGISIAEFRIVGALLGESEGLPQNVLAARLKVEAATLSVALTKLEAKGLVKRFPDPRDSRVRRVRPARQIPHLGEVQGLLEQLEAAALAGLPRQDVDTAQRVLKAVEQNLTRIAE